MQGGQVYKLRDARGRAEWVSLASVDVMGPDCQGHSWGQRQVLIPVLQRQLRWARDSNHDNWLTGTVTSFDAAKVCLLSKANLGCRGQLQIQQRAMMQQRRICSWL